MINISIESFKLLLNEIKQIENKNSFIIIIIRKDSLLSKGTANEEMASQDRQLHPCDTDSKNTSLLVNNWNISFSLLRVFEHRTLHLRWRHSRSAAAAETLNNRRAALDSRGTVSCCFHQRRKFFFHH